MRGSFAAAGQSAYRIITPGVDGFVLRTQMIRAAERTLDPQYLNFRGDGTGRLIGNELLRAADRGVRVRILVSDGDTQAGDEQIRGVASHMNIEVRVFNPFSYRGHSKLRRRLEYARYLSRLDYPMHDKLLLVDNAAALLGGRNIGNRYFQLDPTSQFADEDAFAAGRIVANRFDHMVDPKEAYAAALRTVGSSQATQLMWRTESNQVREEMTV